MESCVFEKEVQKGKLQVAEVEMPSLD